MSRCLILGFGNPLRSDDGFGWKAALTLEKEIAANDVRVMAVHQLTPDLAEAVAISQYVLFLDASHEGKPGEFLARPLQRTADVQVPALFHSLSPAALLELARQQFGREPNATLLTVTGANFEFGEQLSPAVEDALKQCLKWIMHWLRCNNEIH